MSARLIELKLEPKTYALVIIIRIHFDGRLRTLRLGIVRRYFGSAWRRDDNALEAKARIIKAPNCAALETRDPKLEVL
jgi:hypothetical protein